MPARVVFLGPPGTGKGTQAQRAAKRFGLVALSSGDTLRRQIRARTPIGVKAEEFVSSGALVPDEVITGVMLSAIDGAGGSGFILDGFPRTVPQAEALGRGLTERNSSIGVVLDFQMADETISRRIASRRVCSVCDSSYNVEFLPPRKPGVCDRCGGRLEQRVDDREDVVLTRLVTYRRQTAPLVEYYSHRGLLRAVDAAMAADDVESRVAAILESLDRR
ncbi:MAG: adenylate kinase [Phycisphaerae bacterium]